MVTYSIKDRNYPTLRSLGIATQHFPRFCNHERSLHSLDVVLLSFIFSGNCTHMIDGDAFPSSGPTLGVTHLDQRHGIVTDPEGIEITNLYLDLDRLTLPNLPPPLNDILPRIIQLCPRFANKLNRILRIDLGDGGGIIGLVRSLHRELDEQALGYEEAAMDYFKLFLIESCRHALRSGIELSAGGENPNYERLELVRVYLEQHFREDISLDMLAEMAGLTPNYLCRVFKEYCGKTIVTYLVERRIQAAMLSLRGTDDKVLDIAYDCGFRDLSYFNRTFRKLVGSSPGAYRGCRVHKGS